MEYSIDGGGSWQILGLASDPNWYNSSSTANGIPRSQWTGEGEDTNPLGGNNATVHEYSYDLAAFNTESSMLYYFLCDITVIFCIFLYAKKDTNFSFRE